MTKEELLPLIALHGSIRAVSRVTGLPDTTIRRRIGTRGAGRANTGRPMSEQLQIVHHEGRVNLDVENGRVLVFSDAHFHPDTRTTAFRAFLMMVRMLKPVAVVANGDLFDGGTISRYPRIGWDNKPTVAEELKAVKARLDELAAVCKEAGVKHLIWTLGNHDARFETFLAAHAPQYEGVEGFTLKDRFPEWQPCWTFWVNDDTLFAHYYHTGMQAVWNNLLKGQVNMVTSHRHSPEVRAYTNVAGRTIYGVDTGCLADAFSDHNVDYQRGLHGNHRSAFALLTWREGNLLMPELVQKFDEDKVQFRGHVLDADTGEVK